MTLSKSAIYLTEQSYQHILKPLFFKMNPEFVHERMTSNGELFGRLPPVKAIFSSLYGQQFSELAQTIHGITFKSPIGLSAGFDYDAKLTQILPAIGFGFGTIGTISNLPYGGNPKPMLGRLPKSRSLMVNKGFKNQGVHKVIAKLEKLNFEYPVGISVGRTNIPEMNTQQKAINDISQAFQAIESSKVQNAYYELNISCPNLSGNVTFYPKANLKELLDEIDKLHLKKPLFIKMPIEKTNEEVLTILEEAVHHNIQGIIIGNLQKNRSDPSLIPEEVKQFSVGNFSGKPTWNRSNELIKLAYKHYHKELTIIGCGGVFSAEDAYTKIKLGSSLIQLITGMIFQGPQLIAQINYGLAELLKRDGLTHISQAIGIENK